VNSTAVSSTRVHRTSCNLPSWPAHSYDLQSKHLGTSGSATELSCRVEALSRAPNRKTFSTNCLGAIARPARPETQVKWTQVRHLSHVLGDDRDKSRMLDHNCCVLRADIHQLLCFRCSSMLWRNFGVIMCVDELKTRLSI
jgi:hypothetical protein